MRDLSSSLNKAEYQLYEYLRSMLEEIDKSVQLGPAVRSEKDERRWYGDFGVKLMLDPVVRAIEQEQEFTEEIRVHITTLYDEIKDKIDENSRRLFDPIIN